ncbi:uncharacterized protein EAF01_005646 [Botrytis porri]|uniref:uncharacterized protein n=1 Tax=Botrytis porri TaxID=87229 RepID=UPI0018FF4998|nr:uncharacterized protein EAF01_005646 [Botrytis porri]KAF7905125.1 hypothetical protein EAF01_005646 [Botrytis porri]
MGDPRYDTRDQVNPKSQISIRAQAIRSSPTHPRAINYGNLGNPQKTTTFVSVRWELWNVREGGRMAFFYSVLYYFCFRLLEYLDRLQIK